MQIDVGFEHQPSVAREIHRGHPLSPGARDRPAQRGQQYLVGGGSAGRAAPRRRRCELAGQHRGHSTDRTAWGGSVIVGVAHPQRCPGRVLQPELATVPDTAGCVLSAAHCCDQSSHEVETGCSMMCSPAKPLTERGEDVGHHDLARSVVTGQMMHRDRQVTRITLGAGDIHWRPSACTSSPAIHQLGEDSEHRLAFIAAAARHVAGKRLGSSGR